MGIEGIITNETLQQIGVAGLFISYLIIDRVKFLKELSNTMQDLNKNIYELKVEQAKTRRQKTS